MNGGAIGAIMAKDLREFSRDRFFVVISLLGLVFYVAIFWFLPDTVDETVRIGVGGDPTIATALEEAEGSEGLVAEGFDAREDLGVPGGRAEPREIRVGLDQNEVNILRGILASVQQPKKR